MSNTTLMVIDGANVTSTCISIYPNNRFDWDVIRRYFVDNYDVVLFNYYTSIVTDENGYTKNHGFYRWLSTNGFRMITKDAKIIVDQATGRTIIKGNMDLDIACDTLSIKGYKRVILATNDSDFVKLADTLSKRGVVPVFAVVSGQISREIMSSGYDLVDLAQICNFRPEESSLRGVVEQQRKMLGREYTRHPVNQTRDVSLYQQQNSRQPDNEEDIEDEFTVSNVSSTEDAARMSNALYVPGIVRTERLGPVMFLRNDEHRGDVDEDGEDVFPVGSNSVEEKPTDMPEEKQEPVSNVSSTEEAPAPRKSSGRPAPIDIRTLNFDKDNIETVVGAPSQDTQIQTWCNSGVFDKDGYEVCITARNTDGTFVVKFEDGTIETVSLGMLFMRRYNKWTPASFSKVQSVIGK